MNTSIKRIIFLIFFIIIIFSTKVLGNFAFFYADNFNVSIKNIDEKIRKIEIIRVGCCIPSEIFKYDIVKEYGTYVVDEGEIEFPIFNKSEITTDKENENIKYYKGYDVWDETEKEIRLYNITNYDKNKYIFMNENDLYFYEIGGYANYYFDTNLQIFTLLKIKTIAEIKEYKIDNNELKFSINGLKEYNMQNADNILFLRFYTEKNDTKDIYIGDTGYSSSSHIDNVLTLSDTYDYKTGKCIDSNELSIYIFDGIIKLIIKIGFAILFTIIIELLVAKKMKIKEYSTIIKVNFLTQLLFHLIYIIPQTIIGYSLVDLIINIFYELITLTYYVREIIAIIVIEIPIVILEYRIYKKYIKDEDKGKLFLYSLLANVASFGFSIILFIISYYIFN